MSPISTYGVLLNCLENVVVVCYCWFPLAVRLVPVVSSAIISAISLLKFTMFSTRLAWMIGQRNSASKNVRGGILKASFVYIFLIALRFQKKEFFKSENFDHFLQSPTVITFLIKRAWKIWILVWITALSPFLILCLII